MEAKEIYDKIKKRQANYKDLVQWCDDNKFNMDLNNKLVYNLYNTMINYAMRVREETLDKTEASIFIYFFAKKNTIDLGIDKNVSVEVLEQSEYEKKYGKDSEASCVPFKDNRYKVVYSQFVVKKLMSSNKDEILSGMQTIFHEVRHVVQNMAMKTDSIKLYKKWVYIMTLETITRKVSPEFYYDNYNHLLKENDAQAYGLKSALQTIKDININLYNLYDKGKLQKQIKKYDDNFYKSDLEILGLQGSAIKTLDTMTEVYICKHIKLLNKHPILKLAYNEDGTRKDIRQLLKDRDEIIRKRPKNEIDELYNVIINQKFFDYEEEIGTKHELLALDEYIEETGTEDEFIYNLIRYRLNRSKLNEEEKKTFISKEKEKAKKVRKAKKRKYKMQWYKKNKQAEKIESISNQFNDTDIQEIKEFLGKKYLEDYDR